MMHLEAVISHIQEKCMKQQLGLNEDFLDEKTKYCNVFMSPDFYENERLMIIIQGSYFFYNN